MADAATVTVGKDAMQIIGGGGAILGGHRVILRNRHADDELIIGGDDVSKTNGFSIDADSTFDLGTLPPGSAIWAIRGGSSDIEVQVLAI